jgi:hypothetical protein
VTVICAAAACLVQAPAAADAAPPQIHTVAGLGSTLTGASAIVEGSGSSAAGSNPTPASAPPAVAGPGATVPGAGPCVGAELSGGECDGVPATDAAITTARSVAALPDGGFLYLDSGQDLIREVSPDGIVTTVAGNGTSSDAPDGTLAIDSGLNGPVSVAPLPDGGFLITEYTGSVVRMVSPGTPSTARITTIAGTGFPGDNGPSGPAPASGPATALELNYPTDAVPTPSGGVLIADTYNDMIRLLPAAAPGATMTTIAGGGACDDATQYCDGVAAGAVALDLPDSVSPLQDGSGGYLIAEYGGDAIREVSQTSPAGTFSTVAGTPGSGGYAGDGGSASSALLTGPESVASLPGGGFVIADSANNVIRLVSPAGIISTLAGNGQATYQGDGGPAAAASLFTPSSVSPAAGGDVLVADQDNGLIREITIPPVATVALDPPSPNGSDGWYVTAVSATVSTTQGGALNCQLDPPQVPSQYAAIFPGCPFAPTAATITGNGAHALYAASQNGFGDDSDVDVTLLKIDVGQPAVTCTANQTFPFGTRGALVTATLSDPVSGPASQLVSAAANTSALGDRWVWVSGMNDAGTGRIAACTYTVTPLTLQPAPATLWKFTSSRRYTTVDRLVVEHVPLPAAVNVSCRGRGCAFALRSDVRPRACERAACERTPHRLRTVKLTELFAGMRPAPGAQIAVSVTEAGTIGRVVTFTIRTRRGPVLQTACLAPGSTTIRQACPPVTPAR